ncbi:MAG TPA: hypothetical protein DEH11_22480 [Actinobacteria bacterium]|jgi:hypothetical protein|nr:hypothetical protein [Actinomycetota bacterium]
MFAIAEPSPLVRFRPVPQAQSGSRTLNGWPSGTWLPQVTSAPLLERQPSVTVWQPPRGTPPQA